MHPDTLKFYKYTPIKKTQFQGKFCRIPFDTIQIDNDGDVQLCNCQLHMPYTIGNIFKNSLQEIWNNHEANQVRQAVADGDFTYCNWACSALYNLKLRPDELPQVRSFPKIIKLDLDLSCNLKCASCREHVIIEKNSEKIQKQIELFEEIKQWALVNPTESVTIMPLTSGEIFASHSGLKFLESLNNYPYQNLKLHITSNGTLITKNKNLLDKINPLIVSWSISIDAAGPETYSQVRGGDWDMLCQGLEYIKTFGRPVQLNFVVQKNNWHDIEKFADFASQYNNKINYTNLLDWGHWTIKWWHDNNILDQHNEHYEAVLRSLQQASNRYPGKVTFSADIIKNLKKIEHN
jgi:radical SAM protein with 4Fe4S-binding SPASM domain